MGKEDVLKKLEKNIAIENYRANKKMQDKITSVLRNVFPLIVCTLSIAIIFVAKDMTAEREYFYEYENTDVINANENTDSEVSDIAIRDEQG